MANPFDLLSSTFLLPANPFARIKTVSFVLVSPSTVIILNDLSADSFSAIFKSLGEIAISVVIKDSIVASLGYIIPEPFAIPPILIDSLPYLYSTAATFETISVVIIASAASIPPVLLNFLTRAGIPFLIFSIGRESPITPVDATRIFSGDIPRVLAVRSTISSACLYPVLPIHAFALPLFTITPLAFPFLIYFWLNITGAAFTRFSVNTPAAQASTSEKIRARSFLPVFLMPQDIPEARIPLTAVIPPFISFIRKYLYPQISQIIAD